VSDAAASARRWLYVDPDPETRALYGVLNDRTKIFMEAFGVER
jgi:hypothetical protein